MIQIVLYLSAIGSLLFPNETSVLEGAGVQLFSPDHQSTLLVQGKKSGKWGWTKGHRESFDTSWLDTALREVKEESGFEVGKDYSLCSSSPIQWGKRLYWTGITHESQPQPFHNQQEHRDIRWVSTSDLASLPLGRDVQEWQLYSNEVSCD